MDEARERDSLGSPLARVEQSAIQAVLKRKMQP